MRNFKPYAALWLIASVVVVGCDNECPRFDVLQAVVDPPRSSPPDDVPWFGGARGDVRYERGQAPPETFDTLVEVLTTGTSTPTGVRWTAFTRDERLVVIDQPVGQPAGTVISVSGVADDVAFTGGYGTFGWWQPAWMLKTSTPAVARANLIRAFSETMDMVQATGTIEIAAVDPLELRVNIVFEDDDGDQIRMFSDVRFDRRNNVEICSP